MNIKWHKNILHLKNRKIEFKKNILKADLFDKWVVVALPNKLYFLGSDEYIVPFPISSVDISRDNIIYQSYTDSNIYSISHPYEEEELIFHSPYYHFKFLYEKRIYVLEKDGKILLTDSKRYYQISLTKSDNQLIYKIVECTSSSIQGINNNPFDIKNTCCTLDEIFNINLYGEYIIMIYENTATYLKLENNKFIIGSPIYMNDKITISKVIKLDLKGKFVEFLQINNVLFYKDKFVARIDKNIYPEAFKFSKYSRNSYKIFWTSPNTLERKILATLKSNVLLEVIAECIKTKRYDFRIYDVQKSSLDFILEMEFVKSKTSGQFLKRLKTYDFLENSVFYDKINTLLSYNTTILENPDFKTLLSIKYRRIFFYNESLLSHGKPRNLAYKIIHHEKNKDLCFNEINRINFRSFFKKCMGDDRMLEVVKLFYEPVRIFELDENNVEDVKERNYVLRVSSNIGKAYCFYNNNIYIREHSLDLEKINEELIYPLIKNGITTGIELKDKTWKNWPTFNFGCYKILSCKKEWSIKAILNLQITDDFLISGMVYGLGLKKFLKGMDFTSILELINEEKENIFISIIVAYGVSNRGIRNNEFEEVCYKKLLTDQSLDIKIGSLIGLSNIFAATKNLRLQNVLKVEIDRIGIYKSDKNNKNNIIFYDKNYSLICTFNLARVIFETNEFIKLNNRLCEIILNGICLKDKKRHKRKFERFKGDPLDEIFYSNLFLEECDEPDTKKNVLLPKSTKYKLSSENYKFKRFEERISEIEKGFENFTIWDVYKYAGIIFHYGIYESIEVTAQHIEILLKIEAELLKNNGFRVLFDYMLITFCLFSKSNCSLDLLKIIRRQIKRTESTTKDLNKNNYVFTNSGVKIDSVAGLTYGDIEKYKMCLGILAHGLSKYEITNSKFLKFSLISTFYINWPTSPHDQEYFTFFRYELFQNLQKKSKKSFMKYFITKFFKSEFKKLNDKEKKYVIDVMGDYYENYHNEKDYVINIDLLKDLIIRSTLFGRWSENPTWRLKPYKYSESNENNYGGKVFLPQSVLEDFVALQIQPPYTFQISRIDKSMFTHCGVLEFTAAENSIIVPSWMYNQLEMDIADEIKLTYKSIEMGTYLKLLPHSPIFLEVENPKVELENVLRFYPTLSLNDEIECMFSEIGLIKFTVTEIDPIDSGVIYTVDTDLSVDFCEPLGYKEKLEDEKTVNKYLEIKKTIGDIKVIGMSKLGISFNTTDKSIN